MLGNRRLVTCGKETLQIVKQKLITPYIDSEMPHLSQEAYLKAVSDGAVGVRSYGEFRVSGVTLREPLIFKKLEQKIPTWTQPIVLAINHQDKH